jgi:putative two-component system response regulator
MTEESVVGPATLLLVDDEPQNREILRELLDQDGYTFLEAADGETALAVATTHRPDLLLLDIMMPGLDGLSVCRRLRADPALAELPIVLITALDDRDTRLQGFIAGADDFIGKPFDRSELRARVRTIVRLNRYRKLQAEREELERVHRELQEAYETTLEGWSRALDLRDRETEGHTQRVTVLTLLLAQTAGIGEADRVHIRRGALLHDIGKMGVPDAILLKPGPLTPDEWGVMRRHPVYARDLLAPIAYLRPALAIPYGHHEKWDGTGYPQGLHGEAIPLAARLFAVVDIWDALTSDRPYRAAWPAAKAREHLRTLAGSHLDPAAVDAFLRLQADIG